MICPKCKNPIEGNTTICEWCGSTLHEKKEVVFCPKCKNIISENALVCEWCGCKIKNPEMEGEELNWRNFGLALMMIAIGITITITIAALFIN